MTVFKVFPKRLKKINHKDLIFKIKNNLGKYSQLHAFFFNSQAALTARKVSFITNRKLQGSKKIAQASSECPNEQRASLFF